MTSSLVTTLAMICCCFMMSLSWCSTGSHAFVVPVPKCAARVTTTAKTMKITMTMRKTAKMLRTHHILYISGGIVPKTKREECILYSTSSDDDDDDDDTKNDSAVDSSISSSNSNSDTTSSSYPIDLPSPILLASSMVLAIASTGSIFELSGGSPVLGFVPTLVIAIMGIPLCFFLFYAAIQKGIAETEADDIAYSNQRRGGGGGNKW